MSVNKAQYEIGDLIHTAIKTNLPQEAALVIGVDDTYETYNLLPLQVDQDSYVVSNEKMSFHVAHKYFLKV
jgi:hypothetical protein